MMISKATKTPLLHGQSRDPIRAFSSAHKDALIKNSGGRCEGCCEFFLDGGVHFHHIVPWASGGRTSVSNGECLCVPCHLKIHKSLRELGVEHVVGTARFRKLLYDNTPEPYWPKEKKRKKKKKRVNHEEEASRLRLELRKEKEKKGNPRLNEVLEGVGNFADRVGRMEAGIRHDCRYSRGGSGGMEVGPPQEKGWYIVVESDLKLCHFKKWHKRRDEKAKEGEWLVEDNYLVGRPSLVVCGGLGDSDQCSKGYSLRDAFSGACDFGKEEIGLSHFIETHYFYRHTPDTPYAGTGDAVLIGKPLDGPTDDKPYWSDVNGLHCHAPTIMHYHVGCDSGDAFGVVSKLFADDDEKRAALNKRRGS